MHSVFVDTHCHLDQYQDPVGTLEAAAKRGVVTIAVTELPSSYQRLKISLPRSRYLRVAIGLHPLRATRVTAMELRLFDRLLPEADYVGEIGLDFSRHGKSSQARQIEVFERALSHPAIRGKVATVHTRGAERECIRRLEESGTKAILHWYSGSAAPIDSALQAGLYFSINPAMLRSKSGQRVIHAVPPDRVLCETDGPYTRVSTRTAGPSDVPVVVDGLARVWGVPAEEARARIFDNMSRLTATRVGSPSQSDSRSRTGG